MEKTSLTHYIQQDMRSRGLIALFRFEDGGFLTYVFMDAGTFNRLDLKFKEVVNIVL